MMTFSGCAVREIVQSDLFYFKTAISATGKKLECSPVPDDARRYLDGVAVKISLAGNGDNARITAATVGSCVLSSHKCFGI